MSPNENIVYFLHFIIERQNVFMKKAMGEPAPWTNDSIIADHKFTNVYRFLDWESQHLLRNVIGDDNRDAGDTMFRVLLFKMLNLGTTWIHLESIVGPISYDTSLESINAVLDEYVSNGGKVFSSAYLQASNFVQRDEYKYLIGKPKHYQYLTAFGRELFTDDMFSRLLESKNLKQLCETLQTVNGIGSFMSYQFAQDLNYTKYFNHDMNSYVQEGPGSIRGVDRCFNNVKKGEHGEVIKWTFENLDRLMDEYGMAGEFDNFNGHGLQLPDIQNCFCESDKYMRGAGVKVEGVKGKSIKQKYNPTKRRSIDKYVAPPKWGVPDLICG